MDDPGETDLMRSCSALVRPRFLQHQLMRDCKAFVRTGVGGV